jgi:internalin A
MIKYKFNDNIDMLDIDLHYMEEGLLYAKEKNFDKIRITNLNLNYTQLVLDLTVLCNFQFIQKLNIAEWLNISKNTNIEPIYKLKNLTSLSIDHFFFKIDFSLLPQLEELSITYSTNYKNIGSLINLRILGIGKYKKENCSEFKHLTKLVSLNLFQVNYCSLIGLENLNIKRLKITYNNSLVDLHSINTLENLEELWIEKCKGATNLSILKANNSIKKLRVDTVDSISFIENMPKLEDIYFLNYIEGNMNSIITSKSLKKFYFYPNKKHYTHSLEELKKIKL